MLPPPGASSRDCGETNVHTSRKDSPLIRNRLLALFIAAAGTVGGMATISTAAASADHSKVRLAPPKQKIGGTCQRGTAGCSKDGKFKGSFFGEG
jgi:hypothetical protein